MPSLSPWRYASALALGAALAAQQPTAHFLERHVPPGECLDVHDDERWLCCRIVDAITGAPIEGAEVLLIAERPTPVPAELHWAMRAEADDDGFVSVRVDAGADDYAPWAWLCARADGYGQRMSMSSFEDPIVRLMPDVPMPVQVRDWADRPVPDVLVGFCSGCGHTPDLVHGTTGQRGIVTFAGVDLWSGIGDFYLVHPELELGYLSPLWFPGRQPMVLRAGPGVVHDGVVVDEHGRPVAGAFVGLPGVHRGPWARTRPDGSFQLCGLDSLCDLWVHTEGRRILFATGAARGLRLQLPDPADDNADGVQVVELDDEQSARLEQQSDERRRLAEHRQKAWPRVVVRTVGLPDDGTVTMRTRRESWSLDESIELGAPVALPDDEFVFVLDAEDCVRYVAGDRQAAVERGVVRLAWFPPTMVEGRVVDVDGLPATGRAALVPLHHDTPRPPAPDADSWRGFVGAVTLPTTYEGPAMLWVEGRRRTERRGIVVDVPQRGDDAWVDFGTVRLPGDEPLRAFELADGAAVTRGRVRLLRAGYCDPDDGWSFELSDDGGMWLPDLLPGDALVVEPDRGQSEDGQPEDRVQDGARVVDLPTRFVIGDRAPNTFRVPGGELRFDVDADGAEAYAVLGEHCFRVAGPTVVRGIEPGTHRVFLAAEGRRSAEVEVVVADPARGGRSQHVRVALPARR